MLPSGFRIYLVREFPDSLSPDPHLRQHHLLPAACSHLEVTCVGTIRAEAKLCDGHMRDMKSRPGTIYSMRSVLQEMRNWQARGMECMHPMCTDFRDAQASAPPHPTRSHPPSDHFLDSQTNLTVE